MCLMKQIKIMTSLNRIRITHERNCGLNKHYIYIFSDWRIIYLFNVTSVETVLFKHVYIPGSCFAWVSITCERLFEVSCVTCGGIIGRWLLIYSFASKKLWLFYLSCRYNYWNPDTFQKNTMGQHTLLSLCHVLMLALCISAAEDFDWTKNERGSFHYGTFPTGNTLYSKKVISHVQLYWFSNLLSDHRSKKWNF